MLRFAERPGKLLRASAVCLLQAILCCVAGTLAQSPQAGSDPLAALRNGTLVVWIVSPQKDPVPLSQRMQMAAHAIPTQSQEQTAGSFGQTASSVGQTAGSTGQTAGDFGQAASTAGQTAGDTGQTAGSFGKTAGSVGTSAGDAGQTAGSFGVSTSDLAQNAAAKNGLIPIAQRPKRDKNWDGLTSVYGPFPSLNLTLVDVFSNDLQAQLAATAGTPDAPDVLLGAPIPWPSAELARRVAVTPLWQATGVPQTDVPQPPSAFTPEAAVLRSAPHPREARAYAVWFADGQALYRPIRPRPENDAISKVAVRAVLSVLGGGSVGADADPEIAEFDRGFALKLFAAYQSAAQDAPQFLADVTGVRVFGGLAIVTVRTVATGSNVFGVAHSLLVLRRDPEGRWRVLQISPNLPSAEQSLGWDTLVSFSAGTRTPGVPGSAFQRNEGTTVLGISQAAPLEGASSLPQPDLSWDNLGGGTLQVVEWQQGQPSRWSPSNLFFVPDNRERLATRVTARFATADQYRWRVWSLGPGGALVLSPWRTLTIGGR